MWKIYAIGFAVMAVLMVVAGATLVVVTLGSPASSANPQTDWLIRAAVAIVLGVLAATLSTLAWRQSRRPAA